MGLLAVVEIEHGPDGFLPRELIRLAYQASRRGQITLVLQGVTPWDIDREIDPLVKAMPLNIPGLLYVDGHDAGRLAVSSAKANMIFISSATAQSWNASFRFRPKAARPIGAASAVLDRISRPTRLSEWQLPGDQQSAIALLL